MKSKNINKLNKIFFIFFLFCFFILIIWIFEYNNLIFRKNPIVFDKYEVNIYYEIKDNLLKTKCSIMWNNQREFINGIIRKYRPKKIVEIGVKFGGSSIIILNAIKDIKNAHLYSIDVSNSKKIGICVEKYFPYLMNKWTLFTGDITAKYVEKIGKNIDLALIDTIHFEPGEILDFLMILPFLKDESIIIFHDIDHQITHAKGKDMRNEWAPYIIFNLIRGKKFLPSGPGIMNKDIGAVKLEKKQKRFIFDYCRALGGQWEYFPSENHIQTVINYFKKYYNYQCLTILKEAINFNRIFVKDNPKDNYYVTVNKRRANKTKEH